jgi:hypothetical protein
MKRIVWAMALAAVSGLACQQREPIVLAQLSVGLDAGLGGSPLLEPAPNTAQNFGGYDAGQLGPGGLSGVGIAPPPPAGALGFDAGIY